MKYQLTQKAKPITVATLHVSPAQAVLQKHLKQQTSLHQLVVSDTQSLNSQSLQSQNAQGQFHNGLRVESKGALTLK